MRRIALVLLLAGCSQDLKGWHKDGAEALDLRRDNYGCMLEATHYGGAELSGNAIKPAPSEQVYMGCMMAKGYEPKY